MITVFQNSYVSVAEANSYFSEADPAWVGLSTPEKEQLLVVATRYLDDLPWLGVAVDPAQPLAWPRRSFAYHDPRLGLWVEVDEGDLPRLVAIALFNQVSHLQAYPSLVTGASTQDFESIKVGPIELTDSDSNQVRGVPAIPVARVRSILGPLLIGGGSRTPWRAW